MKKIFFILTAHLLSFISMSQGIDQSPYLKMPDIAVPSPNVASIEKFGNIPVNYSTGVASIDVPIWQIKCGDITWPVSLSYHAGGVKVDEVASSAGASWALIAEGVISRAVVGKPDEATTGEPDYTTVTDNDWYYLYRVRDGLEDSEMDVYSYNFNGKSGKFMIKQDGSIFQIPYTTIKITNSSAGFVVVDEAGNTYTFDKKETNYALTSDGASVYTSSWHLTKVQTSDKKQAIDFIYTDAGNTSQVYEQFTQQVGFKHISEVCDDPSLLSIYTSSPQVSASSSNIITYKLSQINFPNGSILLNYLNDRTDPSGSFAYRLTDISINQQTPNRMLKKFKLFQSYFSSGTRLRLDSVQETKSSSSPVKTYGFEYDNTTMAGVGGYAQDKWGFNNGKINGGLLQTQSYTYNGVTYPIGNADRSVDTSKMKACMLIAVKWPTGGRTEYTYDANRYYTNASETTTTDVYALASGNGAQNVTTNFTYPSNATQCQVSFDFSRYDFSGVTGQPYVQVEDVSGSNVYYSRVHFDPANPMVNVQDLLLTAGNSYKLRAVVSSSVSEPLLFAKIHVSWQVATGVPAVEKGGGVRVRLIKNYTATGVLAGTDYYEYDTAVTLTPYNFINQRYSDIKYGLGHTPCPGGCRLYISDPCRIFNSGSIYPASSIGGAAMMYRKVTKYKLDGSGVNIGKTIFEYDVVQDQGLATGNTSNIAHILINDWKNGALKKESHYRRTGSTYELIKTVFNEYAELKSSWIYNLKVHPIYSFTGGCYTHDGPEWVAQDIEYDPIAIYTGVKKLTSTTENLYDNFGNAIQTITNTFYGNAAHDFVTKTTSTDSKNVIISKTLKYPVDFTAAGNPYSKMITANMVSPVIESKQFKEVSGTSTLLSTVKIGYKDWKSDGLVLAPDTIKASVYSNPLENKIVYTNYTDRKNPAEVKKDQDKIMSYIYDYNYQYPIAEVNNASQANIAYTSFEADGKGNWIYSGNPVRDNTSPTGKMCYTLGSSISRASLSAITYIVSYWKKSGTVNVNGVAGTAGRTINGWTYYEHKIINPASGTITVTGTSGIIDELRLYPSGNVLMTTSTFDPLVGVTSQCDANNKISYYEYDELQRLILIRDEDKNIIKKFAYNYAGRPEYQNIYYSVVKSGSFQRTSVGCGTCQVGSMVTYTVPANSHTSTVSQTEADQFAQDEVDANGQAYADAQGTCISPPIAPISFTNVINPVTVQFHNNCTGTNYTFPLNSNFTNFSLPNIPQGNYEVTFTITPNGTSYKFRAGQYSTTTQAYTPVIINNVTLGSSTNIVSVTLN